MNENRRTGIRTLAGLLAVGALLPAIGRLVIPAAHGQDAGYVEGRHYRVLPESDYSRGLSREKGICDVVEVFWYGCGSCAALDPMLNAWVEKQGEDIRFSRSPAIWNEQTRMHARLFFTLMALELGLDVHEAVFTAIHRDGNYLLDEKGVMTFLAAHGQDPDKAGAAWRSFAVDSAMRRAESRQREWRVTGVPALLVDGRFLINTNEAVPTHTAMLEVAEYLSGVE